MPIPVEALAAMMAGQQPPNYDMLPLEERSRGALVDQRVPQTFSKPPLHLRDQYGFEPEQGFGGHLRDQWPLLPVGDVKDFPLRNFHRPVGPTPQSADYMIGRKTDPGVSSINPDRLFWEQWMTRQLNRKRIDDMGGLRG